MKLYSVLFLFLIVQSCGNNNEKVLPKERTLTEAVYASAVIQPDSLYQVYAIVSGILDANLVEEGDMVVKNEQLLQIINSTTKINSENAKLALSLAKENYTGKAAILSSIEDEITAAKLNFRNDSINYYRQKNLWDQHIGSKVQYDTKKLNYELASNQLKLLQNKYHRTENELHTALKQAQNNYQSSSITTQDFTVESKINGKVYALYKEPGEIVTTMEPLASVGSAHRFIIELLVDEVDIVKISLHQDVILNLDAYKDMVFKGTISKIYPKKDERNQTFKVEAEFIVQPKVLYPGLSGEANIIIAQKEKVLTLPKAYITDGNKVKTDDGIITIVTGLENMDYIEILSGISKNTYVYKQN
ncbi:HlyD family efflux transporter periplasmic adaptor subunit [Winogradskyella sp. F6397]|uniref:HlyD family efflux transporter periplasmic adaptor subunit n=1 Tax=Winogradskyella marina TaxID=2785530 RepID=A0ABS0EKH9_9FLAO|nr:HlyD family efflux transporter periplasmic adaptor subunit [Winogradskyella marina]MBF8150887.1 HlyD family efflux transporter periplasmic adaptor subunit [Winogradskyella marina]